MTRTEATKVLKEISTTLKSWGGFTKYPQAIDMAIEALQTDPIVYCRDCTFWHYCEYNFDGDGFCCCGEREEE